MTHRSSYSSIMFIFPRPGRRSFTAWQIALQKFA
jgi:hypothetical protein